LNVFTEYIFRLNVFTEDIFRLNVSTEDIFRLNVSTEEYQFVMTLRLLLLDSASLDLVNRLEDHSNLLSEVCAVNRIVLFVGSFSLVFSLYFLSGPKFLLM